MFSLRLSASSSLSLDPNIHDIGAPLASYLTDIGMGDVRITDNSRGIPIRGRSWEMAAVMASLGRYGSYTGTVSSYDGNRITFGPVHDVDKKDDLDSSLVSYAMIRSVNVP